MRKLLLSIAVLLCVVCVTADAGQGSHRQPETHRRQKDRAPVVFLDSTKERDGLKGPVRRVETEIIRVELRQGKVVSKSRSLLERTLYDEHGQRVENETYPVVGNQVGQEKHKYDAQGNLAETVVRDARGSVLSRIVYEYKLDDFGNWVQMTASVAVSKAGKIEYEPTEITKRSITYYLTDDASAAQNSAGAENNASVVAAAPTTAEGVKVSKRAETVADAKPQPPSLAKANAEGALMNVGVLNARTTELPKPAFPVGGLRLERPITVTVEVVVDITGRVAQARALAGAPESLRETAENAARRALFLPFYVNGRPVRAKGLINYSFDYLP
ncbi:MAG TPA: energy transducer TonB [Pyrinomonadaceae bacterium]|nr:energy transducer TonB [Pyrinomonadaceae bacterium]